MTVFGTAKKVITSPFSGMKRLFTILLAWDRLFAMKKRLDTTVASAKEMKERNQASVDLVDEYRADFGKVLHGWQIDPENIPSVMKSMRVEIGIYASLATLALCSAAITPELPQILAAAILYPAMSVIAVTRYWRMKCLENAQFIPFWEWIRGH